MARAKKVVQPVNFSKDELKTMDLFPEHKQERMSIIMKGSYIEFKL